MIGLGESRIKPYYRDGHELTTYCDSIQFLKASEKTRHIAGCWTCVALCQKMPLWWVCEKEASLALRWMHVAVQCPIYVIALVFYVADCSLIAS